jgi:hypothetical protein
MKKMKIVLGSVDEPCRNGRVYPRSVMEKAIEKRFQEGESPVLVRLGSGEFKWKDVIGEVDRAWIDDDRRIIGEVSILDTEKGKSLQDSIGNGNGSRIIGFPIGHGTIKRDGSIETIQPGYNLEYFSVEAIEDKKNPNRR